eukprot:47597-Eustigmatos_ZCMA.PRE.1
MVPTAWALDGSQTSSHGDCSDFVWATGPITLESIARLASCPATVELCTATLCSAMLGPGTSEYQ